MRGHAVHMAPAWLPVLTAVCTRVSRGSPGANSIARVFPGVQQKPRAVLSGCSLCLLS